MRTPIETRTPSDDEGRVRQDLDEVEGAGVSLACSKVQGLGLRV